VGGRGGTGREMTQTLCAHMNKRKKKLTLFGAICGSIVENIFHSLQQSDKINFI
jgi:hypothetical protein